MTQSSSCVLFELPLSGLLKISGVDAKKLLQGQLTCDVDRLKQRQAQLAAHCNPQGRIISLFWLWVEQDHYFLFLPLSMLPLTLQALKKYSIFYKLKIEDVSSDYPVKGVQGAVDPRLPLISLPTGRFLLVNHSNLSSAIPEVPALLNQEEWKYQDMLYGLPTIYPATNGKLLPHEINLHLLGAVDFEKGCYTGQEIIARMHYRGKIKKHLYLAKLSQQTPPCPGQEIMLKEANASWRAVGLVIDHCFISPCYQVLVMLEDDSTKNGCLYLEDQPITLISSFHENRP